MKTLSAILVAVALTSGSVARADDALPPPQYSIKQSDSTTGTRISRKVVQGSAIPLNRTYAQLTEEEQRLVRSQYEAMRPTDEPPFPIEGLRPIHVAIAEVQRHLLAQGSLSLFAEIDAEGVATSVSVYQSPDPRLTQAAAAVLMLTRFKPAICRGQPCKMSFPLRVTFALER